MNSKRHDASFNSQFLYLYKIWELKDASCCLLISKRTAVCQYPWYAKILMLCEEIIAPWPPQPFAFWLYRMLLFIFLTGRVSSLRHQWKDALKIAGVFIITEPRHFVNDLRKSPSKYANLYVQFFCLIS